MERICIYIYTFMYYVLLYFKYCYSSIMYLFMSIILIDTLCSILLLVKILKIYLRLQTIFEYIFCKYLHKKIIKCFYSSLTDIK